MTSAWFPGQKTQFSSQRIAPTSQHRIAPPWLARFEFSNPHQVGFMRHQP
ncbi:hypothetical protein [Nodularia sp. UHCC 0506]|nr:hypothetical protein [Nodularia sp. UHCC 0506]MEA5517139.1 hypothetical protein [Nodularia sp. UHCC 0506]